MEAPDEGEVLVGEPLSPIANSRSLLHPRMTCAENIAVLARVMGVDAGRMAAAVSALCRGRPVGKSQGRQQSLTNASIASNRPWGATRT